MPIESTVQSDDLKGVTSTSYLSRPSIELSRVQTAQRGNRWFANRHQPKQHRVVDVDVDDGLFVVDSTLRFRIDEVIEVSVGVQTVQASVESVQHNPLTQEQRYVLSVQRTAEETLNLLDDALSSGDPARVERRGPGRAFSGSTTPVSVTEEISTVIPIARRVA